MVVLLAAVLAVVLVPAGHSDAATPDASRPSAARRARSGAPTADPTAAVATFPGVDLAALGYHGAPLDRLDPNQVGAALPGDLAGRVGAIVERIESVRGLLPDIRSAVTALRRQVARLDARIPQARRIRAERAAALDQAVLDHWAAEELLADLQGQLAAAEDQLIDVAVSTYVGRSAIEPLSRLAPGGDELVSEPLLEATVDLGAAKVDRLRGALPAVRDAAVGVRETRVRARSHASAAAVELARAVASRTRVMDALWRLDNRYRRLSLVDSWLANEMRALVPAGPPAFQSLPRAVRAAGGATVSEIGGMRVHSHIAASVVVMRGLAVVDGIDLRGTAHRPTTRQVQLRREHCGHTDEDIWQKPPGLCSPPTALPGTSMHELGLAIDFENMSSRSTPEYRWMATHAWRFGLNNLPSEPCHWRVNGR